MARPPFLPSRRQWIVLGMVHAVFLLGGIAAGAVLSRDLPGIGQLDVLSLPQVTVLTDRDGDPLESFGTQRRQPIPLSSMSPWYLQAVVATEDPRFESHFGVDPIAVARAVLVTVRTMDLGVEGASTITMQLARDQFLHKRKTIWRKVQEAVLATQIEKLYSKEEILALYCNRIYLGHGRYGIEAAAQLYFDKPASELNLPEAALLAGLSQRPEALTPFRHPERAKRRRDHVLRRMVIEGVLDAETARAAIEAPLGHVDRRPEAPMAPHFVEDVRRWLLDEFGEDGLYERGLQVETTLDTTLQLAAERAVALGLHLYGQRHRQIPEGRPLPEGQTAATFESPKWARPLAVDDIVPAVVLDPAMDDEAVARLRIDESEVLLDEGGLTWTRKDRPDEILEEDTIVSLRILELDENGEPSEVELASAPSANAALVALDVNTGEVLALVGGRDFEESEYDLALQARRQAGSAFKPVIFASALENGFLPSQRIPDVPTVVVDAGSPEPYQPENYERNYEGYTTLRHALEHSRNIPTLRLLDAIGYDPAVELARRLGIATDLKAFPSLSLGAFEVKLIDLVAAYGAFANGGVLVEPSLVRSVRHREEQLLYEATPETEEVLAPEVAAMVTSLLEGTILRGTGRAARILRRPMGGKTGTTDEFSDAWFVGFTPSIAVGVWVGHAESNRSLGRSETGARAALPIWIRFFEEGLGPPSPESPAEDFLRPPGLVRVLVDPETGLRAGARDVCGDPILEVFPQDREPQERCRARDARRLQLPYPLQRFPIDPDGRLLASPRDVAPLVATADGRLDVTPGGRALSYTWERRREPTLSGSIDLDWSLDEWQRYLFLLPLAREEESLRIDARKSFLRDLRADLEAAGEEMKEPEKLVPARLRDGVDGMPARIIEANRSGRVREFVVPDDPR